MTDPAKQPEARSGQHDEDASMFDIAPVSLWLEDYGGVRRQLQEWQAEGVTDLRAFLLADLSRCSAAAAGSGCCA